MIDALNRKLGLNITQDNFNLRAEQMRPLVNGYATNVSASAVLALLVVWLMWGKIAHSALLLWLALLYVLHTLEFIHWLTYPRTIRVLKECKRWQLQFLLTDILGGAIWGSAGLLMFVPGEPLYQALLLSIMMGLSAGAIAGNQTFLLSQRIFVVLVIFPILFNFLQQGIFEYYLLAGMVSLFVVFVMKTGRDQSKFFELSICRGFENAKLASESQHANDQLRLSDELLRQSQSVAKLGSWRITRQGYKFLMSDETYRIFGIPVGTPVDYDYFMAQVYPDDRDQLDLAWLDALKGGGFFAQHRIVVDGEARWIEERAVLDFDAQGHFCSCTGSVQDITERKKIELELHDSMHKLEEKELAKTRFLAAAGHDLRQPVTAASLFVYALKLTSPTPHQSELIGQLDASMKTFADLLEQLLNISKFDAGLITPELTPFNLAELFNWIEQNFTQAALGKRLRFRFYFPMNKSLVVRTDIGLLKSAVMNLVSNAIKFTVHGGILVSARVHGGKVILQVWDTGIGIAAENCAHIFDEFYQVANQQRNREAGLGLGLSICQRTLSLLGSEVTCHSRPGRGSVFTFSLPLDSAIPNIALSLVNIAPPEIEHELLVRDKRIVVVEDDALVADGLVNLLRELGASVRHFSNAEEALRLDDIASADYFIVDYALGGELTGLNFLVALQQRQSKPIRAVVITGETSSRFIRNVVDSPWPVLHKPISFPHLSLVLRSFADSTTDDVPSRISAKFKEDIS